MNSTRILILGGTRFVGRMLVERLIQQDFEPLLFHRTAERNSLFPKLEHFNGDRETEDIKQIVSQDWDIVVDFSCQMPLSLQTLLEDLRGRVGRYILISSISALEMDDLSKPIGVDQPLLPCSEEQKRSTDMSTYGPRKAETERVLAAQQDIEGVVLRPALMYGKYDYSDRLYYWIDRVRTQAQVLLPDNNQSAVSLTYGPDLANAIVSAMRREDVDPVYNAITPPDYSLASILTHCEQQLKRTVERVELPADYLLEHGVQPWQHIPLWLNGSSLKIDAGNFIDHLVGQASSQSRAMRATIAYYADQGWPEVKYGLSKEREAELLESHAATAAA